MEILVQLLVDDVRDQPKLLISCYGGAEGFTMTDSLEREFMNGIGQLAATKGQSYIRIKNNNEK